MRITETATPPMGWNSFDCYGLFINEEQALANLAAFVEKLKPAGYEYFCIDGGWYSDYAFLNDPNAPINKRAPLNHIDAYGRFIPSPTRFPRGMQFLAERCHENGVKFGLHIQRGIGRIAVERNTPIHGSNRRAADIADLASVCSWCPFMTGIAMEREGAQAYYDSWIGLLASWGVDMIKADDIVAYPDEIEAVARAIDKVERPILLSLSPGRDPFVGDWPVYEQNSNMLRITTDIWDRPDDLLNSFYKWERWQDYGGPACWLDLDMIPFGALQVYAKQASANEDLSGVGVSRQSQLTSAQKRSFITQRALASSPLFFGGELTMTPEEDFAFVTHPAMLECLRMGRPAKRIYGRKHIDIRRKNDPQNPGSGYLGIFNTHIAPADLSLSPTDLGFSQQEVPVKLASLWDHASFPFQNQRLRIQIASGDVALLKF